MQLNNMVVQAKKLDGITFDSMSEFVSKLLVTKNLVADVIINGQEAFSCHAPLMINNNHVIVCANEQFAFDKGTEVHTVVVNVHQGNDDNTIIMSSATINLSTIIDAGDCDAELYFGLCCLTPECSAKRTIPRSRFKMLHTKFITPTVRGDIEIIDGVEHTLYITSKSEGVIEVDG